MSSGPLVHDTSENRSSTFQPVNASSSPANTMTSVTSHTELAKPAGLGITADEAANHAGHTHSHTVEKLSEDESSKSTSTDSYGGVTGQKPLPTMPKDVSSTAPVAIKEDVGKIDVKSSPIMNDDGDIEMRDSIDEEDEDVSDGGNRKGGKRRTGQRFYCTDYPPCNLSFTRSEHLLRHVRKHTGERPFKCHCGRKFSRLDNLRQHAQTVHVNEDIPIDSLAATGTRFQRQIRTDRVGPTRARSSTYSNAAVAVPPPAPHGHGHRRNMSASSVLSVSSMSNFGDDGRRPPPETPQRLYVETYNQAVPPPQFHFPGVGGGSPTNYSASRSNSYVNSPLSSSGIHSPASRGSGYWPGHQRRLSVPVSNAFQSSQSPDTYTPTQSKPGPPSGSHSRTMSQGVTPPAEADDGWRRRTWHNYSATNLQPRPSTGVQQIVDLPRPVFHQRSTSATRLPGIQSFDAPPPLPNFLKRPASPMQLDQAPTSHPANNEPQTPTNRNSWDPTSQTGINRLQITNSPRTIPELPEGQVAPQSTLPPSLPTTRTAGPAYRRHRPSHSLPTLNTGAPLMPRPEAGTTRSERRKGWYAQPPPNSYRSPILQSVAQDLHPSPEPPRYEDERPSILSQSGNVRPGSSGSTGPPASYFVFPNDPRAAAPSSLPSPPEFKHAHAPPPVSHPRDIDTTTSPAGLPKINENPLSPTMPPSPPSTSNGLTGLDALAAVASGRT